MHPPDEISAGNILNTLTLDREIKLTEKKVKVGVSNEASTIFTEISKIIRGLNSGSHLALPSLQAPLKPS